MGLSESIHRYARTQTWSKAKAIASKELNFKDKKEAHTGIAGAISAKVVSSQGWPDYYSASILFDAETEEIMRHYCDCLAHYNYSGPCKHCCALAINYSKNPASFEGNKNAKKPTSAYLAALLESEKTAGVSGLEVSKIHLIPIIDIVPYRGWVVKFKVTDGGTKEYSVKNISEFVSHVLNHEFHEYGKYLAFNHDIQAFDVESQKIVNFLINLIQIRSEVHEQASHNYYYSIPFKISREVVLGECEMVTFFDALENYEFDIKIDGTQWTRNKHMRIKKENPPLDITIDDADEGCFVSINNDFAMLSSGSQVYIWIDGKAVYKCDEGFLEISEYLSSYINDSQSGRQFLAKNDAPIFCESILPKLEKTLTVKASDKMKKLKPQPVEFKFYLDKKRNLVSLSAIAIYGEHVYAIWGEAPKEYSSKKPNRKEPIRNVRRENQAIQTIKEFFNRNDPDNNPALSMDEDIDKIANLIYKGLPRFLEFGEVYTTPAFDKLRRVQKPTVTVDASVKKGVLKLDVSSADLTNSEISELLKTYRLKTKYHLLSTGALVDVEELEFDKLERIATDLDLSQKDIQDGSVELPKYRAFYIDSQKGISSDDSFKDYMDDLKAIEEKRVKVPNALGNVLRPYQKKGLKWLENRAEAGCGGILADEMGLGKSLQLITLLLLKQKQADAPSLIVCPSSLIYNWKAEFERFAPKMNVATVAGNAEERKNTVEAAYQSWQTKNKNRVDVLITSYDLARIDIENYENEQFFFMTLDEAQYIKNTNTLTTKAVKKISAKHKFALTGTPIENKLTELWSIFDFLMPGILGSKTHFRTNFEKPIAGGDEEAQKRLQTLVGPFMLRRCKRDVLKDLPEKLESVVYSEMNDEQKSIYQAFEKRLALQLQNKKRSGQGAAGDGASRQGAAGQGAAGVNESEGFSQLQVLAELTKLRQLCCDPRLILDNVKEHGAKLDTIQELIDTSIDAGEKVLVFSQFTSYLSLIADNLKANKIKYYTIVGSTPKKKRLDLVNAFNENDVPVFLISLKAGGTGLNLTGASVVIHADPWWNDAAQQQASDRAHRIGQTRVVNVLKVIAKDTIEERIVKLQESKRELSEEFVKTGTISLSSLSEQDLFDLLGG